MDKLADNRLSKKSLQALLPPRHSIVWKLAGWFLLCITLLLGVNWLLNNFALESYYRRQKSDAVQMAFTEVNSLFSQDYTANLEIIDLTLDSLANNDGISSTIWAGSRLIARYRAEGTQAIPVRPTKTYLPGSCEVTVVQDTKLKTSFITLTGALSNGFPIEMRTSVEGIKESVGITNQFLLISGAVTLLVSLLLVFFFSRRFTRPIRELSRVAGSVARLDFQDRYTGGGRDELADLGASINSMSISLERTISDLKTANRQLMNDIEQKNQQNEVRRAFISNVSHELKTPIALISTYAEGLKEDIADGAANRDYYCEVIEDEAQKMSELIKRMTMLMQLEAGGEQLVIERFDITELLDNLMNKMSIRFSQKGIVPILPESGPVYVWADDYLMENVLTNFLSNALNHVNEGGRVEARIIPKEDGRVRVTVFNTGSHIPEEDLPRVWESFYKVDKARTRAYGGTGIGLSVVAAIMKAHGMPYGAYNCRSAHGDGVEFYIELESR